MVYSIAIPVLGQANFLSTALLSIQAQTCRFQLAIMDATQNHSVQDILENYTEILSYRRHGADSGQSAAIQEGWDQTDGDIVTWLCADDYYFPYALEEVEKIFSAHDDVDVVYGDSVFVDGEGNFLQYCLDVDADLSTIFKTCSISQPSCFLRRSALEKMGKLNAHLHYIMDWDLWTQLYKAGAKFHYLPKPLSAVRMYSETKTASRSKARYTEINSHLKENVGFLSRIRVLLGFYYSDLKMGKKSGLERGIFGFLDLLHSIKNFGKRYSKKQSTTLYGFDPSSNLVKKDCEIVLPFYGKDVPRQLVIHCENVSTLQVFVNNNVQEIDSVTSHEDGCRYTVNVNKELIGSILKVTLSSDSTNPWQLHSVNIV